MKTSVAPLRSLSEVIECDLERLGGVPIFRGTRVPIKSLFDHVRAGDPLDVFLDDFPGVTREQAQTVLDAAAAHLLDEFTAK